MAEFALKWEIISYRNLYRDSLSKQGKICHLWNIFKYKKIYRKKNI